MIIFPINELCGCKIIMTTANEYNLVIERYSVFIKASHSSAEPLPFPTGGGKSFLLGGSDDVLESVLGLGDLADLTVTNDETDYGYDVRKKKNLSCSLKLKHSLEIALTLTSSFPQLPSSKESSFRKTWNPKYTLRSHFDGVRALDFHPVEPCLVTVSEDHTLKLWNLTKTVPAKK